ncbi:MAG: tRNA (adenosine(37)-N6)-threonylcarbamoyltransferase complex ATPase subunit type 1 TsaE [Methylococcales bacterium]|nr:tRNA (adenosine(37)-N6)-threonylcarbamoyltransferase complex ATPase subunit type 1 TsaE [Methylococcales bacterium]
MELCLHDPAETEAFGAALWRALPEKCLVFLYGELGTGKTTLLRGLLRAAGHKQAVRSPTYSLVEEYELNGRRIFHFDLYRLQDSAELEWMGMADYLAQPALCCIEWPQMGSGYLPEADLEIHMAHQNDSRMIKIRALAPRLKNTLKLSWKNRDILL